MDFSKKICVHQMKVSHIHLGWLNDESIFNFVWSIHLIICLTLCTHSGMVIELQTIHELILHVVNVISGLNGNTWWVQEG